MDGSVVGMLIPATLDIYCPIDGSTNGQQQNTIWGREMALVAWSRVNNVLRMSAFSSIRCQV